MFYFSKKKKVKKKGKESERTSPLPEPGVPQSLESVGSGGSDPATRLPGHLTVPRPVL